MSGTLLFKELFEDNLPLSLQYGEKCIDLHALNWSKEHAHEDAFDLEKRTTMLDDCLQVELSIRQYKSCDAIEWFCTLRNDGIYDTQLVSDVNFADFTIEFDPKESPFFLDYNGSNEQLCDFLESRTQMFHRARRTLRCEGGRSSSCQMPYFNVLLPGYGYTMAIGWSGQWQMNFVRPNDEGNMFFTAGMEDACFRLHPGEQVELPKMLAIRWEGDEATGHNVYRKFALEHIVPKHEGEPVKSPLCMSSWGGSSSVTHLKNAERIAEHKLNGETYWIDAGWYGNVPPESVESDNLWYNNAGIGDWQPSTVVYPNGMEEISDAMHKLGLGFLLWYEPERAKSCAERVQAHPDWYIGVRGKGADMLLNLGHEPARAWLEALLCDAIERYDMQVLRVDFNFGPLKHWQYGDAPDRRGITELKYVAGFYTLWDNLLARFPGLIIDNCASGGRRLDYEASRRSIPLFRSDYTCFGDQSLATACQLQTYYLSRFLPVNACGAGFSGMDTYKFHSFLSAGITMGVPQAGSDEAFYAWYREMFDRAKRIREYTTGNMWPLTGCFDSDQDWMAYQLHRTENEAGVIIAFRREKSMLRTLDAELREIKADAQYELEDIDRGSLGTVSGEELIHGWALSIDHKRTCRVIFYKKL